MLLRTILEAVAEKRRSSKRKSKQRRQNNRRPSSRQQQTSNDSTDVASSETATKNNNNSSKPLAYALARSWAWPALTFRCTTHPEEVASNIQDERGETILHWTCLGKPPIDTVQAILNVCPVMAQTRNISGHLPLHGK